MKSGISLIAVLMFMLAATTASIVVYRYIGQENFSSGARLKNSEAYQASQAGLEAVRGWLANKGADAGALIKNFEDKNRKPLELPEKLLGKVDSKKQQKFKVYLVGADTKTTPYTLKFLSEGKARDDSKYSQVGIFEVEGLYKLSYDIKGKSGGPKDLPALFVGGDGVDYGGTNTIASAFINGDWKGNPPRTTGDFVVTGNVTLSGNDFKVGGTTCVGGDLSLKNNDLESGDVFVGGNFINANGIFKNVYVALNINGSNEGGGFRAKGNLTALGTVTPSKQQDFIVDGNFVLLPTLGKLDWTIYGTPNCTFNANTEFSLKGNVWIPNPILSGTCIQNTSGRTLADASGLTLAVNGISTSSLSGSYYTHTTSAGATFRSRVNKQTPSGSPDFPGAEESKVHCDDIWEAGTGCSGEKYVVEDIIKTAISSLSNYAPNIYKCEGLNNGVHEYDKYYKFKPYINTYDPITATVRADLKSLLGDAYDSAGDTLKPQYVYIINPIENTSSCGAFKAYILDNTGKPIVVGGDTIVITGGCDSYMKKGKNGTYSANAISSTIIFHVNNDKTQNYQETTIERLNACYNTLNTPANKDKLFNGFLVVSMKYTETKPVTKVLNGKVVFIFNERTGGTFKLPAMTSTSSALMYFKGGVGTGTGDMLQPNGCNSTTYYNYFIYSLGPMAEINGFTTTCPLKGTVYYPQRDANGNPICNRGTIKVQSTTNILENKDLLDELFAAGIICDYNSGNCGTGTPNPNPPPEQSSTSTQVKDDYYIPATPHLKVTLQSQYAATEALSSSSNEAAKPAILVMPRVVYVAKTQNFNATDLKIKNMYKVLYLNGADQPSPTNVENGVPLNCGPFTTEGGPYECRLTSTICNSDLCKDHPFQVYVLSNLPQGGGNSSPAQTPSSSNSGGTSSPSQTQSSNSGGGGGTLSSSATYMVQSSNSSVPWCKISGCYQYTGGAAYVDPPTYGCTGGTVTPGSAIFRYTNTDGATVSGNKPLDWFNNPPAPYKITTEGTNRQVYMYKINCNGVDLTYGKEGEKNGFLCEGSFDVKTTCANTATCSLLDKSGAEDYSLNVTQGENIRKPKITCFGGASASNEEFIGLGASAINNWETGGYAYYTNDASTIPYAISVSKVFCNGVAPSSYPACGTITVQKPTCNISGNYTVNIGVPPPTVSCGDASASSAQFNITLANDGNLSSLPDKWNASTPTNHSFGNPYEGRVVRMYQIKCDGHELNYGSPTSKDGAIVCGTINIRSVTSSSSGATQTSSSSVTSSSSISIGCAISGTYTIPSGSTCVSVKIPTVSNCTSPTRLIFRIANTTSNDPGGWNEVSASANPTGQFCSQRNLGGEEDAGRVWMTQAYCNGTQANVGSGILCGYITIANATPSSASTPSSSSTGPSDGGCAAGATIITTPSCGNANTTSAVCYKKSGNIAGWNGYNAQGRSCTVNGGSTTINSSGGSNISSQPAASATSDGNVYINCTEGDNSGFGISCW